MDEETLVEAVRNLPCLWQTTSKSYRDLRARENAWKMVASQVGDCTVEQCTKRWKALRDQFVKELKKVKKRKSGDPGPPYTPTWRLYDILTFLQDSVQHRETDTNLSQPEDQSLINNEDNRSDVEEGPQPLGKPCDVEMERMDPPTHKTNSAPPSKRKKARTEDDIEEVLVRNLKHLEERADDEEELFGKTVAATLRRFSLRQRAVAKMRIQTMLLDIEFPDDAYTHPQRTMFNQCI